MKKVENGTPNYYLRSTVLGGQIVAELNSSGSMTRGFVYQGSQLLAVQQNNQVSWMHEDPVVKSKRVTDSSGNVVSTVELDPWGGDTNRSTNHAFQPRRFTTYDRDLNNSDEAMHRRYNRWYSRFDQPDPYDGSYNMANPQLFNRYSYVQNDPVNLVDPSGLDDEIGPGDEFGPGDVIRTNTSAPRPRNNAGFRDGNSGMVIETGSGDESGAGGGPTGAELVPASPEPLLTPTTQSGLGRFVDCMNDYRFDNLLREIGRSAGHPQAGEIAGDLSITGTVLSAANQLLNLTPLGKYPRGGINLPAGSPTSWQHRVGGVISRYLKVPSVGTAAKFIGRVATRASGVVLAFEVGYAGGTAIVCVVVAGGRITPIL